MSYVLLENIIYNQNNGGKSCFCRNKICYFFVILLNNDSHLWFETYLLHKNHLLIQVFRIFLAIVLVFFSLFVIYDIECIISNCWFRSFRNWVKTYALIYVHHKQYVGVKQIILWFWCERCKTILINLVKLCFLAYILTIISAHIHTHHEKLYRIWLRDRIENILFFLKI